MHALRRLLDFLELRPFFTLRSLRIFWWLYIAVEAQRLYFQIWQLIVGPHRYIQTFINPLDTLVLIVTARLLLEIVLALMAYCTAKFGAHVLQRAQPAEARLAQVRAFFDLGPCFTQSLLAVFWFVFLIVQLRSALSDLLPIGAVLEFGFDGLSWGVWQTMLTQLIYLTAYTAGVRLLVEAQLVFLTRNEAAAGQILSN